MWITTVLTPFRPITPLWVSDFCSGQVHRLWNENGSYQSEKIGDTFGNVAGFGQGHDGEVYVLEFSGAIYQVQ